jgi:hypothetical protein
LFKIDLRNLVIGQSDDTIDVGTTGEIERPKDVGRGEPLGDARTLGIGRIRPPLVLDIVDRPICCEVGDEDGDFTLDREPRILRIALTMMMHPNK